MKTKYCVILFYIITRSPLIVFNEMNRNYFTKDQSGPERLALALDRELLYITQGCIVI